jgi:hypothetical protein
MCLHALTEHCLGNMEHVRGARALRQAVGSVPQLDARVGLVAVHLGLTEDAKRLFAAAGRWDLLTQLLAATGEWEAALQVAGQHDRWVVGGQAGWMHSQQPRRWRLPCPEHPMYNCMWHCWRPDATPPPFPCPFP